MHAGSRQTGSNPTSNTNINPSQYFYSLEFVHSSITFTTTYIFYLYYYACIYKNTMLFWYGIILTVLQTFKFTFNIVCILFFLSSRVCKMCTRTLFCSTCVMFFGLGLVVDLTRTTNCVVVFCLTTY